MDASLMSRDASVTLDWADGTYHFRLGWDQWEILQEACDCGPWYLQAIFFRVATMLQDPEAVKNLQPKYIGEVIRVGLIGGGMSPGDALTKTRLYVHSRPPRENFGIAFAVLQAGLDGVPEEPQKKSAKPPIKSTTSRKAKSASRQSMASAQSPDILQTR